MTGSSGGSMYSSPPALLFFATVAACALMLSSQFLSDDDSAAESQRGHRSIAERRIAMSYERHDALPVRDLSALRETNADSAGVLQEVGHAFTHISGGAEQEGEAGVAHEGSPEKHAHSVSGVAASAAKLRKVVDSHRGERTWIAPSAQEVDNARNTLAKRCAEPRAWQGDLWDRDRNASYTAQMEVREALNTISQKYISALSAPSRSELRPCRRVVVSISTIPGRIERLGNLIRSIKIQEYAPDAILIGLPPFAPRLKKKFEVPEYLAKDPSVTFVPLPADFGPLSKVAAAIYHEKDPETCIFTVDDDNEPREYFFRLIATWAAMFPTVALGECGWNKTCITGKVPYICGEGYNTYLFVRQFVDFMCFPDSLPIYNIHQCISEVRNMPRATDVLMGVSNPLYRRGMFKDDFLDIAKEMARRRIRRMLDADAAARAVNDTANMAPDDVVELAHAALEHPDMQRDSVGEFWDRISPPDSLFLVDDVYISAYLAKEGVPRMVVPAIHGTAKPPIELLPKREKKFPPSPPQPEPPAGDHISNVHALHGIAGFDMGNHAAVNFYKYIGFWD